MENDSDSSQRLVREEAEELEHDVVPEHDAVLLLNLGDVAVDEPDDLLEGSERVRLVRVTYFLPVGTFSGFQSPAFSRLNHSSAAAPR